MVRMQQTYTMEATGAANQRRCGKFELNAMKQTCTEQTCTSMRTCSVLKSFILSVYSGAEARDSQRYQRMIRALLERRPGMLCWQTSPTGPSATGIVPTSMFRGGGGVSAYRAPQRRRGNGMPMPMPRAGPPGRQGTASPPHTPPKVRRWHVIAPDQDADALGQTHSRGH